MSGGNNIQGRGEPVDFGKIMNAYRLTNTHHTEIVNCLPLPSLPINYGARNSQLELHDESGAVTRFGAPRELNLIQHSGRIVELLRGTDISYLCLREHSKVSPPSVQNTSSGLEASVLEIDPEAFNHATPGPINRKGLRISTAERREISNAGSRLTRSHASISPLISESAAQLQHSATSLEVQTTPRKKRMTRRHSTEEDENEPGTNRVANSAGLGGGVRSFCGLLDELLERTDGGAEDDEEAGSYLTLTEIKGVLEDLVKFRAKNDLHTLPLEYLLKLLILLDRQVQRAHEREVDDLDDVDSANTLLVLSALEAVQASLTVMTHPGMPKQVYKEEIIDQIVAFTRYQIVHSVFKAYDPTYRQLYKGSVPEAEEDYDELEEDRGDQTVNFAKKGRRKVKSARARRLGNTKVSNAVSTVLHKLCSILALLKDLLLVERLPDSTVLQLTKSVLATFAVDNVQLLQLKAVGVACSVFSTYPEHRSVVIEECASMFWKVSSSKRNLRTYLLPDEEPKQIQMLTGLLLQLVQCSVRLPDMDCELESATEAGSAFATKCLDPAMDTCKNFWKLVLQRWSAPKSQDSIDAKGIVENFVVDLLTTLNTPEFPAASLFLQILCILLFGTAGLKSKDSGVRGAAIELFGLIASRLKQDAIACSRDSLWVLGEMQSKPVGSSTGSSTEQGGDAHFGSQGCAICHTAGRGAKIIVPCANCSRLFHRDCIGIGGHDLLSQAWLCCCCLCKKQLASFMAEGKPSSVQEADDQNHVPGSLSKDGVAVLQQLLLNYLQEVATGDSLATFARGLVLLPCKGLENLDFHLKRLAAKPPVQEFGMAWTPLPRDIMSRLSAALGQQRPLAKGFDRILERLLTSLQENASIPRAKALRAISALVEVDPTVLGDERVQIAVEGRFLDSAISVREAAMDLVGRHIVRLPHVAEKYFDKLAERIMDTGMSVRRRVIKIIRDVCVANVGFARSADACVKIISRINDEESSIQDLVGRTFYELWFEEPVVQHSRYGGDASVVPVEIAIRTQQIVDVLKSLGNQQLIVTIIRRNLALEFAPQAAKSSATIASSQAAVRNRCELMCKFLLESILKAEESTNEEAETRALPYVIALHAFCTVDPTLCAPASDPSCFVVTLQPYLKAQVDNRDVAQLLQSIVFVVDTVLPMLRRPPQNFIDELEKDLRNLVNRYPFQTVIHACIKCVASLSKITPKGVTSYQTLVRRNFKALDSKRGGEFVGAEKANILRCIYCLGMLSRYCPDLIDCMEKEGITMARVLDLLKDYLRSPEFDVKCRALQALGVFCIARPDFMLEKETGKIVEASLVPSANNRLKLQTLRNFCDYLSHVEEQMGASESGKDKGNHQRAETSTAVPVAAGAGDSSIAGGIIQSHWELILDRCLDMDHRVRLSALKVLEIVLRQGLVHPMSCVPQLIALEVDHEEATSKLAHRLVMLMNEKYPSYFETRLGDGLQLSFNFIQSGAATSTQDGSQLKPLLNSKVTARAGIARIYKLIRNDRAARNKFLGSILRKYDTATSGASDTPPSGPPMASFLVYCAEVLASLPFGSSDEPLYVVFSINRILQVRGGGLEANIKATIAEEPLGSIASRILDAMAAERVQEGLDVYDYNASNESSQRRVEISDDCEGIPLGALGKLKDDCQAAMALALLMQLKRHLKIVYGLTDARCQAYTPSEHIKQGEVLQRKENIKEFSTKEASVESPTTVRQMLEQYQTFKRLLKEDAMDYSAYTACVSKKRGRQIPAEAVVGANHGDAHPPPKNNRRKGVGVPAVNECETDFDFDPENDDDQDWTEKRRKSATGRGKGRGRRSVL